MLIDNVSGAFDSRGIEWPGGPGLFETASASAGQTTELQRLGGDNITWVIVGVSMEGNVVINFDLDKSTIRLSQASGTNVFADIKSRRFSP